MGRRRTGPTFAAYRAQTPGGGVCDWLRARAEPAWSRAVEHRFTRELATDTLPDAVYARYLVQDYVFLDVLARLLGAAIAEAPDMPPKTRLARFLAAVTSDENDYFLRAFDALGVSEQTWSAAEPGPVTRRFREVMLGAARRGYPEALAVLLPAEWIYLSWATAARGRPPARFYLAEWIAIHALPAFADFVGWLREEMDRVGAGLPPERQEGLAALFREIAELEAA
ncbi:MAG: TenA family protein, partial [Kiloniellaceae bacterium]